MVCRDGTSRAPAGGTFVSVRVGLIGYGFWGENMLRNLMATEGLEVVAVCDQDMRRGDLARARYPGIKIATMNQTYLTHDPEIDAIVITTPPATHFALGYQALQDGKHVLVTKPLADTLEHAEWMSDVANAEELVLLTDHTFLYTPAVRKLYTLKVVGVLGALRYVDSQRTALGVFQKDVDVVWDLAAHDFSIVNWVTGELPDRVLCVAEDHLGMGQADTAHIHAHYRTFDAHFHVSWLSPVKIRRMLWAGSKSMVVWDDTEPSEKLRVYDHGVSMEADEARVSYRRGNISIPALTSDEALANLTRAFADLCNNRGVAPSTQFDVNVVRCLDACSASMVSGVYEPLGGVNVA